MPIFIEYTYLFFNNHKKETTPLRKDAKFKTFELLVDEKSQVVLLVESEKHVMRDNITLQYCMSIMHQFSNYRN